MPSRNHSCQGKAPAPSLCTVQLHVTVTNINNTGIISVTQHCSAFAQPFLTWKHNNAFFCVFLSSNIKTRYFCSVLTKPEFSRQILIELSSSIFHTNPSSGSRAATGGKTGMTKPPAVFGNLREPFTEHCLNLTLTGSKCGGGNWPRNSLVTVSS